MFKVILFITLAITSCKSYVINDPEQIYLKDLDFKYNDNYYRGIAVLEKKNEYDIEIRPNEDANIIRISNCHRDEIFRDIKTKKFKYKYDPNEIIENGNCILQLSSFNKDGIHQFASVIFVEDETLEADSNCSGSRARTLGVSACQAKVGTLQVIEFDNQVDMDYRKSCTKPESPDNGKTWYYEIKEGMCFFVFRSYDGKIHRLITFGYNEVLGL